MRNAVVLILTLCLMQISPLAGAAQSTSPTLAPGAGANAIPPTEVVIVPKSTLIVVRAARGYNSYSESAGGKMRFEVVQDVIVNGHIVAKAGDTAQGAIQSDQSGNAGGPYGIGYKAANLRFSVDEVYNFCGDTLHVDYDRSEYRRRQGLFGAHKDVEVAKGQMYVPETDRVQRICGERTAALQLPIPDGALRMADH